MSDEIEIPETILRGGDVADLIGVRPRADALFSLTTYRPPGPVGAAYIHSQGPFDGIMGPGGSGKTVASIWKAIRFAIATMPVCVDGVIRVKLTCVRDNYRSLYRTTLQSWFDFFPVTRFPEFFGGQDRPAAHNIKITTVRTVNGVRREVPVNIRAEFFAIADINYELLFKSYETSLAWATEADGVPTAALPFFYSRTARYPAQRVFPEGVQRPRLLMFDFNPPDPDHDLLAACQRGSFRSDFDPAKHPKVINFFRQPSGLSPQAENRAGKSLAEYQAEYDALDRDQSRRMVEGLPGRVKDGMPVYEEEFDYDSFVSPTPLPIDPNLPIHAGFDQDLTPAAAFFQETPDGQIRVLRELACEPNTGVDRFLERLLPILHGDLRGLRPGAFTADPAGFYGGDKAYGQVSWAEAVAQALGVALTPAPTNEWDMRRAALSVIMRVSKRQGRNFPHILVDPSCKTIIKGLSTGFKYRKHHDGSYARLPEKNAFSHPCEALQYGVLGLRGVAGMVATIANANRPGAAAPARAHVATTDWSAFG